MSWLARSLANTLGLDDVPGDGNNSDEANAAVGDSESSFSKNDIQNQEEGSEEEEVEEEDGEGHQPDSPTRRVKEDLTELREALTRQLLGMANFLAPPAATTTSDHDKVSYFNQRESSDPSVSGYDESTGDCSNAGGRFSGGFSAFSDDCKALKNLGLGVGYNRYGTVYEEEDNWISEAIGITDEVLAFAGNIAHHPETWLDFPIEEEDDLDGSATLKLPSFLSHKEQIEVVLDDEIVSTTIGGCRSYLIQWKDFQMSETQKVHALTVERLTPRLAALRIELCPAHMSEGYFWKVYFVLLHSRLNKQDAELLSTPQVVDARAKWMQELQKRTKTELDWHIPKYYEENASFLHEDFVGSCPHVEHLDNMQCSTHASELASSPTTVDSAFERHPFSSTEVQYFDKFVVEEKPVIITADKSNLPSTAPRNFLQNFEDDDDDDWPEDDFSGHRMSIAAIPVGIDEEVSFSDLEDDDCSLPIKPKGSS
ncbi:hypothetical protein Ancab_028807 [Ancistrocladus abbreviatus]